MPADEEACIQEGAASPLKKVNSPKRKVNLRSVRHYLESNQLHALVASKQAYSSQAEEVITQNIIRITSDPLELKKVATTKCKNMDRQGPLKGRKDTKSRSVFFVAKIHKPESSFCVIISERGNWQGLLGEFL